MAEVLAQGEKVSERIVLDEVLREGRGQTLLGSPYQYTIVIVDIIAYCE